MSIRSAIKTVYIVSEQDHQFDQRTCLRSTRCLLRRNRTLNNVTARRLFDEGLVGRSKYRGDEGHYLIETSTFANRVFFPLPPEF